MKSRLHSLSTLTLLCLTVVPTALAEPADGIFPSDEYPALAKFNEAITFYLSFNEQLLIPDWSTDDCKRLNPEVPFELKPGLWGQAVLFGSDSIKFSAGSHVNFKRPGSLAMWVSPYEWVRDTAAETPYLFLFTAFGQGRKYNLARMGDKLNHEFLYIHAESGPHHFSLIEGNTTRWKSGEWHLLVMNWKNDTVALSVDGRQPQPQTAAWLTAADGPSGTFYIGFEAAPHARYLIDEVTVMSRPLDAQEIGWIYDCKNK